MGNSLRSDQLAVRNTARQTWLTEETVGSHPHHGDLPTFLPGHYLLYSILQPEQWTYFTDESAEVGCGDRNREGIPGG